MKIGIIAEYNPFHNGHLYQIDYVKRNFNPELVVCLVTNYFSMRGDISVLNKYDKTKVVIDNGADLVIEFPYLYSCQNADIFARNAVKLLSLLGVDTIVAGSETDDLGVIEKISELEENEEFDNLLKKKIDSGISYRKSFSECLACFGISDLKPNDMLNLKYYDSIKELMLNIKLQLIKRIGSDYLDQDITSKYPSASSLRKTDDISSFVPNEVTKIKKETGFLDINQFTNYLKYIIVNNDLSTYFQATNGFENLFDTNFNSIDELVDKKISKRYQSGRIKRFITYLLSGYTKDVELPPIDFVRVLGFNNVGKEYLNSIKKDIKLISRIKEGINVVLDFEIKLAKIFSVVYGVDFMKYEQGLPYRKDEK